MSIQKLVFALAVALALTNCQSETKEPLPTGKTGGAPITNLVAEIQRRDSLLKQGEEFKRQLQQEIETNRQLKTALRNLERIESEMYQINEDTSTQISVESGGWQITGIRSYTVWNDPCCCPRFEPGIYPTPRGGTETTDEFSLLKMQRREYPNDLYMGKGVIAPGETVTFEIPIDLGRLMKPDTMPADTTQHEN